MTGEVIRWNNISGPETIDATKYIELLEAEVEELNRQVARKSTNGQNELLEYMKSLEPQNLKVRTTKVPKSLSWISIVCSFKWKCTQNILRIYTSCSWMPMFE